MSSETKTPSAEPVAWIEPLHIERLTRFGWADDVYLRSKQSAELSAPLYLHPSPDVRDAERWRWLRAHSWTRNGYIEFGPGFTQTTPEILDRAIDTAIAKERDK
jgi:hypothetical protein